MTHRTAVREIYDRIGPHFAATRPEAWPEVRTFLEDRRGEIGLDIGTGNGRHAELLAERTERVLALDVSRVVLDGAAARAKEHGYAIELAQADAVALPVQADSVDLGVYVATIHHLPTRQLRVRSLTELNRVLAPDGIAIVSAWCVSHEKFDAVVGFDTMVDWTLPNGETLGRYYHIYDFDEFVSDVDASGLVRLSAFESAGNCYAVVTQRRA